MNLVDSWEEKVIEGLFGISTPAWPAGTFLAAFTSDPGESGDVSNEVPDAGAYARIDISGAFAATDGTVKNTADVNFEAATANWGTVTHIGFMASGTHGTADMIIHAALATEVEILNGDRLVFAPDNLQVSID